MKIKMTLQRSGLPPADLLATVDASTTVRELASYLARSAPGGAGFAPSADELTLALVESDTRALDPRSPAGESGLRSGSTVTLTPAGTNYRDPAAGALAVVTVVDGPDTGRQFALTAPTSVIGRERGCEVRLTDPLVSRQHARITVTDLVEIVDLGSANGMTLGAEPITRTILRADDTIRIGDTALAVRSIPVVKGAAGVVEGSSISFVRPPRLDPRYAGEKLGAPEPPERPTNQRFPLISLFAPLLMGALLYVVTKSATSLIFIALSPLMLVGSAVESRISGRATYKRALQAFRADVHALVGEAQEAAQREIAARRKEHPSTAECVEAGFGMTPLLWTRRPGEYGFVEMRLGTGRQPARNTIELPDSRRAPRDIFRELVEATAPFLFVDDVPVVARPSEYGGIGFAGPREQMLQAARGFVAQVTTLHSPAELVLVGIGSSRTARDWDWIKWLPHTSSAHSPLPVRPLAAAGAAGGKLLSELEDLVARRSADEPGGPAVMVLVEDDAPVEHARLVELAERGWKHGVYLVWLASEIGRLPAACRTFLELLPQAGSGIAGFAHDGDAVSPLAVECLDANTALQLARRMAPVVDIGARIQDASDLSRSVSLLALNGSELATALEAVIERWSQNSSILTGPCAPPAPVRRRGTLRAVVGQSAGEPLALDLRADGPHALVGGTTGAGKSELLQAWILSMAAAHSPQRLTFLLVDYKGGSAFRDCVELPHTVGLVTDLSPHLVRRALTSLAAELRYRERFLERYKAKDLVQLEEDGIVEAPPSLVIVVDEFAALVNEVPEFVDGVVNVAQRGRSLGLHLILATQRPAGVIKDNLRANTNLRLALRMADEADSVDVLGSPEAAFFPADVPGRAVSKTGPGRLVPFQTGYAGGRTSDAKPPPEILVEELSFGAGSVWKPPVDASTGQSDDGPTDIKRLVTTIRGANQMAQITAPRKPWLPELKPIYDLADQEQVRSRRRDDELVFGIRDDPEHQEQPTVAFYPDRDGNLAVYGTGGSGKSTLLRTVAIAAGFTVRGGPCHVYGIDFGARGLAMLEDLPHVGSVISGSDHERITRLLTWLRDLIDERALRYSRANAGTITEYRRVAGAAEEPRILLLIDGIAAFRQAYETSDRIKWFDVFTSIASDGRPVGVHVVLSSEQRAGMTTALASAVQQRVVLRMATGEEYGLLNVPGDVISARSPVGRGLMDGAEIQVALLCRSVTASDGKTLVQYDVGAQSDAIRRFSDSMRRAGTPPAPEIKRLVELVNLEDLPAEVDGRPVVGISGTTLEPFTFDPHGSFIITGPPGSGRTSALATVVTGLIRWDSTVRLHYFGNRRSTLGQSSAWESVAFGQDVGAAATALAGDLPLRAGITGLSVVAIESIGDFVGGPAENALQELAKICLSDGHLLLVEGETTTLTSSFGLLSYAKSGRSGLALQPDQSDGTTIFRTNFPRLNRAEFIPGRALAVGLGKTELVQIALCGQPLER